MRQSETDRLVIENMRLVYHMYEKLRKNDLTIRYKEDLISEGMVGLCKAANNFSPDRGVKFSTFAAMCIRNEMLMYLRKLNRQANAEVSLHTVIGKDSEGHELTYEDVIEDESQSADEMLVDIMAKEFTDAQKPLDREILKALQEGHKQSQIGKMLGIKQPTVCRHIRKMKKDAKNLIF